MEHGGKNVQVLRCRVSITGLSQRTRCSKLEIQGILHTLDSKDAFKINFDPFCPIECIGFLYSANIDHDHTFHTESSQYR